MYSYFKVRATLPRKFSTVKLIGQSDTYYIIPVLFHPPKKTSHLTEDTCNFTVDCLLNTVDKETRSKICH